MDFDAMSREELIATLKELKEKRAFTYEDQMKLAILDKSPFTIWASDRDCKITLWSGQCETLYGYSYAYALGKDYVELFVAPDEQAAARSDQIKIIDDAAVFHNIANDIGRHGNTLQLLTNCFRIKDIRSGDYWNAELGLIIDFFEQEKERLKLIITESRKVKASTDQFISNTQQCKEHFHNRKKSIRSAINEGERRAIQLGKRSEFRSEVEFILESLETLQNTLNRLIDEYFEKMQACADSGGCQILKSEYDQKYDELIIGFKEISLDFEELNLRFNGDNTIFHQKEYILKENSANSINLSNLAFDKLNKINDKIEEYQHMTSSHPNSDHYARQIEKRDRISNIKAEIKKIADRVFVSTESANDFQRLDEIRIAMQNDYSQLESKLLNELEVIYQFICLIIKDSHMKESIYEKVCIPLIKVNSNIYVFFSGILMSLSVNIFTTLCFDELIFYNQWLKYFSSLSLLISSAMCMVISVMVINIQNYFFAEKIIDDKEKNDIIYDLTSQRIDKWIVYYTAFFISFFIGIILLMIPMDGVMNK